MNLFHSTTVTILVSDMDEAIRLYVDTLDFPLRERYGNHYAEIQAPGLILGLHPAENKFKVGQNMSIGFGTKDLNSTVMHFKSKGISLTIKEDGPVRIAHFTDPDKNPLYAIEI